ncbi:hypothetical protein RR21198_3138 [Rhodococcus rhodochrous ATCC 21198]|uniref:hypothetical protein n=1 Tax=Rhodococcus TaxID=1827 RepID=UPI0003E1DCDF|nr:hypothetical protein [Rhodococcus aetherivorans]ETT26260.1 hypothetical protein RR21198_3138 [Rhodococcus rhodochrous ATCC 21198]NGP25857.1 hypothetical protein [Rhodococcus aetherivorans]
MSRATVATVTRDVEYLEQAWPSLIALKIPGTARSWVENPRRAGTLSPEDQERLGKRGLQTPAPADIQVLDLIYSITTRAAEIAECLIDVVGPVDGHELPDVAASKDPMRWLATARELVPVAHECDDKTAPWVAYLINPLVRQTARLLGDIRDGQVLNGICPWCSGRLSGDVLGQRTMQIHYPDPDEDDDEPLIICRGINCSPPRAMCGMRWRGHPAWTRREWDWLAKMLRDPDREIEKAG